MPTKYAKTWNKALEKCLRRDIQQATWDAGLRKRTTAHVVVTHLILDGNGNFNKKVPTILEQCGTGSKLVQRGVGVAWSSLKISQRHAVHMAKRRGRSSARELSVPNNNWRKSFDGRARENGEEDVPTVAVIQSEKKFASCPHDY